MVQKILFLVFSCLVFFLASLLPQPLRAAPVVTISASPGFISRGETTTLTWSASGAVSCRAQGGWAGDKPTSGSQIIQPEQDSTTYIIACTDASNQQTSHGVTVEIANPSAVGLLNTLSTLEPSAVSFFVDQPIVKRGASVTVSWNAPGSTCTAGSKLSGEGGGYPAMKGQEWDGPKQSNGEQKFPLNTSMRLSIRCSKGALWIERELTVMVAQQAPALSPPTISLSASKSTIFEGQSVAAQWTTTNVLGCTATTQGSDWYGVVSTSGSVLLKPGANTTYRLQCWNASGETATAHLAITVQKEADIVIELSASYPRVLSGERVVLTWAVTNAATCTASNGWYGTKLLNGSETVVVTSKTTYTLTCRATTRESSKDVTVDVITPTLTYPFPTVTFSASPAGAERVRLSWKALHTQICSSSVQREKADTKPDEWTSPNREAEGTVMVMPASTAVYVLTCESPGVKVMRQIKVTKDVSSGSFRTPPEVRLAFTASPPVILRGGTSTFRWASFGASSCAAGGDWSGTKEPSNTEGMAVLLSKHDIYSLECANDGYAAAVTFTLIAKDATQEFFAQPSVSLSVESEVGSDAPLRVTWTSMNAVGCSSVGPAEWIGYQPTGGSQSLIRPASTSTFRIDCWNGIGTTVSSSPVTLAATPVPSEKPPAPPQKDEKKIVSPAPSPESEIDVPARGERSLPAQRPPQPSGVAKRLRGSIVLEVESKGEAWYIRPDTGERVFLGRPTDAFGAMRTLGVGISRKNLDRIPIAFVNLDGGTDSDGDGLSDVAERALGTRVDSSDSDGDGFRDSVEVQNGYTPLGTGKYSVDLSFTKKYAGTIFIATEFHGEAWYVHPLELKRYYLGRPRDAFEIMRRTGIGISSTDIELIERVSTPSPPAP